MTITCHASCHTVLPLVHCSVHKVLVDQHPMISMPSKQVQCQAQSGNHCTQPATSTRHVPCQHTLPVIILSLSNLDTASHHLIMCLRHILFETYATHQHTMPGFRLHRWACQWQLNASQQEPLHAGKVTCLCCQPVQLRTYQLAAPPQYRLTTELSAY